MNESRPIAAEARHAERPPSIGEVLTEALRADPEGEIVRVDDATLTRRGLERASFALAHRCVAAGAVPGHWVGLLLPQGLDATIGFVGATRSGAGVAFLDPRRGPDEIGRLAARVGLGVVVTDERWAPVVSALGVTPLLVDRAEAEASHDGLGPLPVPAPSDPSTVSFSSGSAGRPKAIVRLHAFRAASFTRTGGGVAGGAGVRIAVVSPFGPPAPMVSLFTAIRTGAVVCPYDLSSATIADFVEFLARHGVTSLRPPVAVYRALVEALGPRRLPDVREVALGSEPVFPSDLVAFSRCFAPGATLSYSYGLTEAASVATTVFRAGDPIPSELARFTTIFPGVRLTVEGPDGAARPAGTIGEIVVRGSSVADGYLDDPDLEAQRFFADPDGTRGFRTGDLGALTTDGALELAGRADDQVKVRGNAVPVGEVEAALRRVPGVGECAVVAVPDARDGARLVGFVVGADRVPPTVGELRRGLAALVPPFMVPAGFRTLSMLPRLPEGKVDRQRLLADGADALPRSAPFRDAVLGTEAIVRAAVGRVLGYEDPKTEIGCDDDFFELGGNSLAAMELLAALEEELAVRIDVPALVAHPTVAGLAAEAERLLRSGEASPQAPFLHFPHGGSAGRDASVVLYPGTADSVLHVVPLARRLPLDVHARLARGIDEPAEPGADHRTLLAQETAALRALPGPLVLAGHSGGGTLALQLAHRLRSAGREVPLVVLVDSVNPGSPWRRIRQRVVSRGGTVPLADARLTPAAVASALARLFRRKVLRAEPPVVTGVADPAAAALRAQRDRLYLEAADRMLFQRLPRYDGDVLLVVARRGERRAALGPDLGWGRLVRGKLTVVTVDGDHTSILEPPDVEELAATLREHFERIGLVRSA